MIQNPKGLCLYLLTKVSDYEVSRQSSIADKTVKRKKGPQTLKL
jgi:hypothetical protein